jgi:eukaryotic-like serine/threonine-protein kinase
MQEVHTPLKVGTVIRGRYVVEDVLGKRSFGTVYLVRDRRNKQKLFILREMPNPGWKVRYQFAFDSMVFRRPDHMALPHVYQVFNDSKLDRAFILMDYIEGPNLETLRLAQPEQRFPLLQVMNLIAPIVDAVTHLHTQRRPIIHGDIKPSNIIVHKEGTATVLVGFSLVKDAETDTTLTFDRYRTPGYKAPEQYNGVTDLRTDIYALGAVLYTLLTGAVPAGALYRLRHLGEKKCDPLFSMDKLAPDIPTSITSAIHRAMSMHRGDRFATVEQFWNSLWQVSTFDPIIRPTWEQVEQPRAEEGQELDANPTEEDTREDLDPTPTKERRELDNDQTAQQITAPMVAIPTEEAQLLNANLLWPQAQETVLSEEDKKPSTVSLQKQPRNYQFKKPGKTFFILLALLVTLLISIGARTGLWFYTAGHHQHISALASSAHKFKTRPSTTAGPNSKVTVTPSSEASIYPKVAAAYNGTIFDIAANVSTKMSLTAIQQQRGSIRGNIIGLGWNDPFQGSIDTAKHIKFSFTDKGGQAALTFDGNMQSDGNIEGTYCSMNQTGVCSDYGIWSADPVVSG